MSKENQVTLKKIATSDFSGGGILNPAQAKKFITFVVDESVMTKVARVKTMTAPIEELSRLHIGDRVLQGKGEMIAPTSGQYVQASGSQIELSTKAFIIPWEISYEQMDDNVEEEGFEETLMKEIAMAAANDIEELAILGDTASGDPFLVLVNGWHKLAVADGAHLVDISGFTDKTLTKYVFSALLKGLPTKYRRNRGQLAFFVNPDNEQDYRVSLTGRDTNVGDNALVLNENLKIFGVDILPVPTLTAGSVVLTVKKNLIEGIWKKIRLEKDKDIYKGAHQFAFHLRIGFAVEKGDAYAYLSGVVEATH